MSQFYIVFLDDEPVLVPGAWLSIDQNKCYWPNIKNKRKIDLAVEKIDVPRPNSHSWRLCDVKYVLGSADTFEQGQAKLKKYGKKYSLDTKHAADEMLDKSSRHLRAAKKYTNCYFEEDFDDEISPLQRLPTPPNSFSQNKQKCKDNCKVSDALRRPGISHGNFNGQTSYKKPTVISSRDVTVLVGSRENSVLANAEKRNAFCSAATMNDTELKAEVLRKLNHIVQTLGIIEEQINIIKRKEDSIVESVDKFKEFNFPFETDEDLQKLETMLEEDTFFQQFVEHLSCIGGSSASNITVNILKKVISDSLTTEYTFKGTRGKKSFRDLVFTKAIKVTVFKQQSTTEANIEGCIARWIAQAKVRAQRKSS